MGGARRWDEERRARAALTFICQPGDPSLVGRVSDLGAAELLAQLRSGRGTPSQVARARAVSVQALCDQADRYQLRLVIPGDDEWPPATSDLNFVEPVGGMSGAPVALWAKGPGHLAEYTDAAVAIVGARAATAYGENVAVDLAADLSADWPVISGLAYGVDAAAHRGAIAAGGHTVAIFAGGLDECYPRGNSAIFEELVHHHLAISEVPPGIRPTRAGFLARNRLIAALSLGTIVVEAGARSGARNTVHWAAMLSRVTMAVPGPITSAMSVTPHRLIRDGEAALVTDAADVRAMLAPLGKGPTLPIRGPARVLDDLAPNLLRAREAVPGRGSCTTAEIALRAGMAYGDCLAALVELQLLHLVAEEGADRWRLPPVSEDQDDATVPHQIPQISRG